MSKTISIATTDAIEAALRSITEIHMSLMREWAREAQPPGCTHRDRDSVLFGLLMLQEDLVKIAWKERAA